MPIWALLALAGAAKAETLDKDKEKRDRALAASTQRYSPWTGLQAQPFAEHDTAGAAIGGAVGGLGLQQNIETAKSKNALLDAQATAAQRGAPTMVSLDSPNYGYNNYVQNNPYWS